MPTTGMIKTKKLMLVTPHRHVNSRWSSNKKYIIVHQEEEDREGTWATNQNRPANSHDYVVVSLTTERFLDVGQGSKSGANALLPTPLPLV